MNDIQIYKTAKLFRKAIESARDEGRFSGDDFDDFPKRCCGDTCYLLGEFLHAKGQKSIYVCGEDYTGQTHAWLVINDERIYEPVTVYNVLSPEATKALELYGNSNTTCIKKSEYDEKDLSDGLIVDITGNQFDGIPVYVDYICDFYKRYAFQFANDFTEMKSRRLRKIYKIILQYI